MGKDSHVGRTSPTFTIEGHPDKFNTLIDSHGVLARIMRSRKCPCGEVTGSPSRHCGLCKGDGFIYDFQRKLLQADEDSDIKGDRSVVLPFWTPILEPLSVEKLIAQEQGGIKKYNINSFDSRHINISGSPLPYHYHKLRVSYYFDRYDFIQNDRVEVKDNILTTTKTLKNGGHRHGNIQQAHGDITLVKRVYDELLDHTFTNYTFLKNQIIIGSGEPKPSVDKVLVDYYYAQAESVLPTDLQSKTDKETWTTTLASGEVKFGVKSWFDLSDGDLITLLVPRYFTDQIITHSSTGIDKLLEFDIASIADEAVDENGVKYRRGIDYYLRPFRDIVWIDGGNQPNAGVCYSIKYAYHPTYKVYTDNAVPNTMENKMYPKTVSGKLWAMTLQKEVEQFKNFDFQN